MASKKVRCPKCHQRVKPQHAADRQRLSCPNCGAWFSTDDDDVLGLNYPSLEAAVEADNRAAKEQAMKDPAVQAAHERRKQADAEYRQLLDSQMLKADPSLKPLLDKIQELRKHDDF